jgi:hypothetical protein
MPANKELTKALEEARRIAHKKLAPTEFTGNPDEIDLFWSTPDGASILESSVKKYSEDQPRASNGRFGAGDSEEPKAMSREDKTVNNFNDALKKFAEAGGSVRVVTNKDSQFMQQQFDRIESLRNNVMNRLSNGDDSTSEEEYDKTERTYNGLEALSYAMDNIMGSMEDLTPDKTSDMEGFVATDRNGNIVAAISFEEGMRWLSSTENFAPVLDVGYAGSTGQMPGSGTALEYELAKIAADRNIAVRSQVGYDSTHFHEIIGRNVNPTTGQSDWSLEDVQMIASRVGKANKAAVEVIRKARALLKYSQDQERDSDGRFGSGTTDAATSSVEFPSVFTVKTEQQGPELIMNSLTARREDNAKTIYMTDEGVEKINGALRQDRVDPASAPEFPVASPHDDEKYYKSDDWQKSVLDNSTPQRIDDSNVGEVIKALDNSFARQTLAQDTVMFRGISTNREFTIGQRFTDKGYSSCSRNLDDAKVFARGRSGLTTNLKMKAYDGSPRVFEILVPKGTHVLGGAKAVGETILPRGSTFEVVGIRKDAKGVKDVGGVIQLKVVS